MGALRSVMTGGSPCRPGLLVFGLLMMVIAGLFAMHVLSMSGPMGHTYPTLTIETEHIAANAGPDEAMSAPVADQMAGSNTSDAAAAGETHCDGCGEPAPSHSMLMLGCVIALLIGLVLLLAPRLLGRGWLTRLLAVRALPLLGGAVLPRARPPSLIVLSISRT